MKVLFVLMTAVLLCACNNTSSDRLTGQARELIQQQCEQTTGFRRVVNIRLNSTGEVTNWTAEATVEFINKVGGVEQKEMPFQFYFLHLQNRPENLCCVPDWKKISDADNRAFQEAMERAKR